MSKRGRITAIIAVICAVVLVGGFGAAYGVDQYNKEQERLAYEAEVATYNQAVYDTYDEYVLEVDGFEPVEAVAVSDKSTDLERQNKLDEYSYLTDLMGRVNADKSSLLLWDNSTYGYFDLIKAINVKLIGIRDWFLADYNARYEALATEPNAEGVTKDILLSHIDGLNALRTTIDEDLTTIVLREQQQSDIYGKIQTKIDEYVAKIAAMDAEEEQTRIAAEQATINNSYSENNIDPYSQHDRYLYGEDGQIYGEWIYVP
jgi:hypothetical protein